MTELAVEWPRGEATACKAVYTGSNPVSTSVPYVTCSARSRAISSVGERFLDTEEVTGSIPVSPTIKPAGRSPTPPLRRGVSCCSGTLPARLPARSGEEPVHDGGAGLDDRPQLLPIDDLGHERALVPNQARDLLDGYPAVREQRENSSLPRSGKELHYLREYLVGDTGIEPVTSSVSGKRSPAELIVLGGGDGI